jgi:hypothetical protein
MRRCAKSQPDRDTDQSCTPLAAVLRSSPVPRTTSGPTISPTTQLEMASQYQHRQFFRRVPNELLARYFEAMDVLLGVDFGELKETEVEPIFEAFTALPEDQQAPIELDFQDINTLACDGGIGALVNEASFHGDEIFAEEISAIDGLHANAMWALWLLRECDSWLRSPELDHDPRCRERKIAKQIRESLPCEALPLAPTAEPLEADRKDGR